jgi:iron-sulfur cluster assembly protein
MTVATGLNLTERAAGKLRQLLAAEGKNPAEYGLRVGVKGGGCSGLMYVLDLDAPKPDDFIFEDQGVKIVVDGKSVMFLRGSVVDYEESLMGAGFKVRNPMEKGQCGCGHSFTT